MSCSEQDGSFFTAFSYLAGPSTQHFSCWFSDRLSPEDYTKEGRKNKKKREAEEKARRKAAKTKAPESVAGYLPFFKGLVSVPLRSTPSPGDRVYWELTALHSGCLPFASHTPVPMGRGSAGNQPPCREGLPSAVYVPRSRRTGYCEMTALQSGRLPFVSHTPVPMGRRCGEPDACYESYCYPHHTIGIRSAQGDLPAEENAARGRRTGCSPGPDRGADRTGGHAGLKQGRRTSSGLPEGPDLRNRHVSLQKPACRSDLAGTPGTFRVSHKNAPVRWNSTKKDR